MRGRGTGDPSATQVANGSPVPPPAHGRGLGLVARRRRRWRRKHATTIDAVFRSPANGSGAFVLECGVAIASATSARDRCDDSSANSARARRRPRPEAMDRQRRDRAREVARVARAATVHPRCSCQPLARGGRRVPGRASSVSSPTSPGTASRTASKATALCAHVAEEAPPVAGTTSNASPCRCVGTAVSRSWRAVHGQPPARRPRARAGAHWAGAQVRRAPGARTRSVPAGLTFADHRIRIGGELPASKHRQILEKPGEARRGPLQPPLLVLDEQERGLGEGRAALRRSERTQQPEGEHVAAGPVDRPRAQELAPSAREPPVLVVRDNSCSSQAGPAASRCPGRAARGRLRGRRGDALDRRVVGRAQRRSTRPPRPRAVAGARGRATSASHVAIRAAVASMSSSTSDQSRAVSHRTTLGCARAGVSACAGCGSTCCGPSQPCSVGCRGQARYGPDLSAATAASPVSTPDVEREARTPPPLSGHSSGTHQQYEVAEQMPGEADGGAEQDLGARRPRTTAGPRRGS